MNKMACQHVNVLPPQIGDLFRIYEFLRMLLPNYREISIKCIITKDQKLLKPQTDR